MCAGKVRTVAEQVLKKGVRFGSGKGGRIGWKRRRSRLCVQSRAMLGRSTKWRLIEIAPLRLLRL